MVRAHVGPRLSRKATFFRVAFSFFNRLLREKFIVSAVEGSHIGPQQAENPYRKVWVLHLVNSESVLQIL